MKMFQRWGFNWIYDNFGGCGSSSYCIVQRGVSIICPCHLKQHMQDSYVLVQLIITSTTQYFKPCTVLCNKLPIHSTFILLLRWYIVWAFPASQMLLLAMWAAVQQVHLLLRLLLASFVTLQKLVTSLTHLSHVSGLKTYFSQLEKALKEIFY